MNKIWIERKLFTEEQSVTIQPNETQNAIVLKINENADKLHESRIYLTYDETIALAKQMIDFVAEVNEK